MTEPKREERDLPECYYMLANNSIRLSDPCVADAANDVAALLRRLAAIERQVLWRTEDMPEDAVAWEKCEGYGPGHPMWWRRDRAGFYADLNAPDYRPDEEGPIWLPILDPPEG